MKIRSIVTDYMLELTEGVSYDLIFEYDTQYELKSDSGKIVCRSKDLFVKEVDAELLFQVFKDLESTLRFASAFIQNPLPSGVKPSREALGEFEYEMDKAIEKMKSLKQSVLDLFSKEN